MITLATPGSFARRSTSLFSAIVAAGLVVLLAGERDPHDGLRVGIALGDDRLVDLFGELVARAGHAVAHVVRSRLDVLAELELDGDLRDLLAAQRGHDLHALDAVHLVFEDVGDRRLDDFRRSARKHGRDGHDRRVDRRQPRLVRRAMLIAPNSTITSDITVASTGLDADLGDSRSDPLGAAARTPAAGSSFFTSSAARSLRPSTTLWVPALTIVSPLASPSVTSTRPFLRSPISIGTRSATSSRSRQT
jgi:hypothetical protein